MGLGNNNMCWLMAKIAGGLFLVYLHMCEVFGAKRDWKALRAALAFRSVIGGSIAFHRFFLQVFVLGNVCGVCVPFCKKLLRSRINWPYHYHLSALWKRRPLSRLDQQPYTTKLHRIRALPTHTGLAKITTSLLRNISTMAIFLQMASHEWNDKFLLTQSPLIWTLLNVPDEK